MTQLHRDIDGRLEVMPGATVPDLAGLPGVAAVDAPAEFDVDATYLDTPTGRLAAAGITLRRCTGGVDPGWRLELPAGMADLHAPLEPVDGEVPAALLGAVRARVREADLGPAAFMHTRRTMHRLRDAQGRVVVEVTDDVVAVRAPGAAEPLDTWREWDVVLVAGERELQVAALQLLRAAGGATPTWSSSTARAMGDRLVIADTRPARTPGDDATAGAILGACLRGQRDELLACDPLVRRDSPAGVHQMRVATRRLRSALATFGPLLDRVPSEAVRVELGWLGGLLGVARDAQVGRDRLVELIALEPADLVVGPVARRLDADRAAAYRAVHDTVLEVLDSTRYFRLLDALDALVDSPPWTKAASTPAGKLLPGLVRHDWERLAKAFHAARVAPPGSRRDQLLHEAAKAAKRARYGGELASPAVGRPAMKFARAAKKLADLLGLHDDSVELRDVLRRVGAQAHLAGEDSFTYGRLHALAQAQAEAIEDELPALWDRVSAGRRRRWMR